MTNSSGSGATYETKAQAQESESAYVQMWLDALKRAEDEEEDWTKKAEATLNVYRGKEKKGRTFNILHSNVETLCPALYNSTPVPDVRRRFADPDPVAKVAADILIRALSFSVDTYDFDAVMKAVIKDGELPGRGVPRVRYSPTFGPMKDQTGQPVIDDKGQPIEEVVYEEVTCDYVPWRYFRRGPGRTWADVPWVAFGELLTKEGIADLVGDAVDKNGKPLSEAVPLNYTVDVKSGQRKAGTDEQSIFKRALVWQIWDRDTRKVITISPEFQEAPLSTVEDPLELQQFFPIPRPYQPIMSTDSLVPIVPYEIYEDLVDELNDITRRIAKLVKQLRPRGGYGGDANDLKLIAEADDGELIPLSNIEAFLQAGGIEKAIHWFPLDPTVNALKMLVAQRQEIKQVIYEVTGIADILRGATNPNETLGAQQLKAQWGSLRIQDRQTEVARVARDLFRLKAEIIANKFSWNSLSSMTGINAPSTAERDMARQQIAGADAQAKAPQDGAQPIVIPENVRKMADEPSREEIEALLRDDVIRSYRIDIESDSTIRGDLARNQQVMTQFLQGTAQFVQSMGPVIQQEPALLQPAMEIYAAFARHFRLGKQAEDALASFSDSVSKGMAKKQQPKPDPKAEIEKGKLALDKERLDLDRAKAQSESAFRDKQLVMTSAASPDGVADGQASSILAGLVLELTGAIQKMNAPRRIVRDERGQAVGYEPVQ